MKVQRSNLPEVIVIEPTVFEDARGYFMETWRQDTYSRHGIGPDFVQDNQSASVQWTLRGLHYQLGRPQGKLVRVMRGEVFDVAVDLRRHSPCFGRWTGEVLSGQNRRQLWIPEGFGHGFLVLSETAEFAYKCTDFYAPEHERCVRWDDPSLAIDWPIPGGIDPILSDKDTNAPLLDEAETFACG